MGSTSESALNDNQRSILVSSGGMTPAYCSPEQVNKQPLSRKTDIWSWAVSVLEMFVGEVCWSSGVAAPEVLRHLDEVKAEGVAVPTMPEDLHELLEACFQIDPAGRPKDLLEITGRLYRIYNVAVNDGYKRIALAERSSADDLNFRALSLLDLGKPREALTVLEQGLATGSPHPECIFNRGLLLWQQGRLTNQGLLAALGEVNKRNGFTFRQGSLAWTSKPGSELCSWLEARKYSNGDIGQKNQRFPTLEELKCLLRPWVIPLLLMGIDTKNVFWTSLHMNGNPARAMVVDADGNACWESVEDKCAHMLLVQDL